MKSAAQLKANRDYVKRAYDQYTIQMPRGLKEKIKSIATAEGKSVNRYILEAVEAKSGLKLTLDGEFKKRKTE